MKIATVTGVGGFIATNLTFELLNRGWKVFGIDAETNVSNVDQIEEMMKSPNFTYAKSKVEELDWIPECDVIFNLAAESHVDNSIEACSEFIDSNIHGVRNLLEIINKNITY